MSLVIYNLLFLKINLQFFRSALIKYLKYLLVEWNFKNILLFGGKSSSGIYDTYESINIESRGSLLICFMATLLVNLALQN